MTFQTNSFFVLSRTLRLYLSLTASISPRPRSLFVSPHSPSRSLSENALSFFLRDVISSAYSSSSSAHPSASSSAPSSSRARSVRGVAALWTFARNASLPFLLRRHGLPLRSSPPSISLMYSFLLLMVLAWVLW